MLAVLPLLASAALAIPDIDGTFIVRLDPGPGAGGRSGGALLVELLVAPDRTIEGCRVLSSTYAEVGNRRVCEQARKMRADKVAKDLEGNSVHGFVTVARVAAGSRPPEPPAFLEVSVRDLPGRATRKSIYLTALVDAQGTLAHCQPPDDDDAAFVRIGCRMLGEQSLPVILDRTGAAVGYVNVLKVDFVEDPPGP